jgi:hypothetical protein
MGTCLELDPHGLCIAWICCAGRRCPDSAKLKCHTPPHLHLVKIYKNNTSRCVKTLIPMHASDMSDDKHRDGRRQKDILHQGVEPCSTAALVRIRYSDAS